MFLLTHLSLLEAANVLLIATGVLTVLSWPRSVAHKLLLAALFGYFWLFTFLFLVDSIYPREPLFFYMQYPSVLILSFFFYEYCLEASGGSNRKVFRIIRYATAALSAVWAAGLGYAIVYNTPENGALSNSLLALPIGLIVLNCVFLTMRFVSQVAGVNGGFWGLITDWGQAPDKTKATASLFAAIALCIIGAVIVVARRDAIDSREMLLLMFMAINSIIIVLIVLSFLFYVNKRFTIASQITSVMLLIFLAVVSIGAFWFFDDADNRADSIQLRLGHRSLVFEPQGEGQYQISAIPLHWRESPAAEIDFDNDVDASVKLPFAFPFYGQSYQEILVNRAGLIAFERLQQRPRKDIVMTHFCREWGAAIAPFCSGGPPYDAFFNSSGENAVIEWRDAGRAVSQLAIWPNGRIEFSYKDMPGVLSSQWTSAIGVTSSGAGPDAARSFDSLPMLSNEPAIWFDLSLTHRLHIHKQYAPVVAFVLIVFIFTATLFRWFISRRIGRPMEAVLNGLEAVRQGDLDHKIDLKRADEFSLLADGYNEMIAGLGEYRDQYDEVAELMEAEIHARTSTDEDAEKSKDDVFKDRILSVIEANVSNYSFQIGHLAEEMSVSTRQLHRRTVELTGMTPSALIRTVRLSRANQLLRANAANVSEAAFRTGFRDVSYFSKLYSREFGLLPSEAMGDTSPKQEIE